MAISITVQVVGDKVRATWGVEGAAGGGEGLIEVELADVLNNDGRIERVFGASLAKSINIFVRKVVAQAVDAPP